MIIIEGRFTGLDQGRVVASAMQVTNSLVRIDYTDGSAAVTGGYLRAGRTYASIGQTVVNR